MKKLLKPIIALVLLTAAVFTLVACGDGSVKGLTENNEWNNDISTYERKNERTHPELISYESEELALAGKIEDSANYMSLNGTWDFALATKVSDVAADFMKATYVYPDPATAIVSPNGPAILDWDTITVPGSWEMQGYDVPIYTDNTRYPWANDIVPAKTSNTYNPVGMYRKEVTIPAEWEGKDVFINFEGVSSAYYVYVNGEMVGYAEDSYTSVEFYLTPYLKAGETNLIAVKVFKFADGSWIEANDSIKLGGITRNVYLYATPSTRITDIKIETTLDSAYENALLNLNVNVAEYGEETQKGMTVKVTIYDEDGKVFIKETALNSTVSFDLKKTADCFFGKIGGRVSAIAPSLWSAENPYRYTIVAKLYNADGELVDISSQKFGIMSSGFLTDDEGRQTLVVNGTPITLYGINYNEHDADTGTTLSYETMLADVKLMKELNINAIRSPGRPLSIDMLDLCDEYGIYVIDDMSLCSTPYSDRDEQSIPGNQSIWQNVAVERLIGVLDRDRNHPSVIVWSLGTDSGNGDVIKALRNYLLSVDPRLLIYDDYVSFSDMAVSLDWDISQIREYLADASNKKPLIFQSKDMGYLNGAGNLATWVDLCMTYDRAQGGFFANWIDFAIYTPIEGTMREAKLNTPVATNPELYHLTYSGSWGETVTMGNVGLKGILNADRTLQSDAEEFRRAYAPVYVTVEDAAAGIFTVTNRYDFRTISTDDYVIEYELVAGTETVLTGKVSGIELAAKESAQFTVDYGTLEADTEYFLNVSVTHTPDWADGEVLMSSMQFEITDYEVMPKSTEVTPVGNAFEYTFFTKPEVYTTAYDIVKTGAFFFTNPSDIDLNEIYELRYVVYETNNTEKHVIQETGELWESPGRVIYSHGTVDNFSVPANTAYGEVNIDLPVKAVAGGTYSVELTLVAKKDVGEVPAGFAIRYVFDETTLGETIPFEIDPSRTAVAVLDEAGNAVIDATTMLKVMSGGDPVYVAPEVEINLDEGLEFDDYNEFLIFENGTVTLSLDAETGLITEFSVNDKDIFARGSTSPVGNFVRQPTGGDLVSDVVSKENTNTLTNISRNASSKRLAGDIGIEKISDDHYRLTVNYLIATYSYEVFGSESLNSDYTVTYDIYGDGTLVVSVAYSPSIFEGLTPYEVSSVITIDKAYQTVTYYGRGPEENYSDKLAGSGVGLFENVYISDMTADYLHSTDSGNRSDVRWAVFKDQGGNGFILTSDTKNFDLNVSKLYPWETAGYTRTSANKANTVVRVITDARGVNSGNIADANYYSEVAHVNPGASYSYSFRISPITSSDDVIAKSEEYVQTVVTETAATEITDGGIFALQNIADVTRYLTTKTNVDGSVTVSLAIGTGTENQMWKQESGADEGFGGYRLLNIGADKYLTPVTKSTPLGAIAIDFGLADYHGVIFQYYNHDNKNEVMVQGVGNTIHVLEFNGEYDMGGRVAGLLKQGKTDACWIYEPVDGYDDVYLMRNAKTGYYLTVADAFSFRNPVIESQYERFTKYDPDTNWTSYEAIMAAEPMVEQASYDKMLSTWVPTEGTVTTWQLLPGATQRWQFVKVAENGYQIVNNSTGNALAIVDGALTEVSKASAPSWTAYEEDGLYGFVDEATGLALSTAISGSDIVLGLSEWNGIPNQMWALSSDADLEINMEAGDEWFYAPVEE